MSEEADPPAIHPYGPELAYLDHQITGTGEEYFDVLHEWVGIALQHPDGIQHSSLYRVKDVDYGTSQFVDEIIPGEDEGRIYVSDRINALVRMAVFRKLSQNAADEDGGSEDIIVVPSWTKVWYDKREGDGPHDNLDQDFARDCIKAMWFVGEEWELFYSMKHMLDAALLSWATRDKIWSRMQRRYSYRVSNEKYVSRRVGLVLSLLVRAGLIEKGEKGYKKTRIDCKVFDRKFCPIAQAEELHRGRTLEHYRNTDKIDDAELKLLQSEIYGGWAIATTHLESGTSLTHNLIEDKWIRRRRANKADINDSICRMQESIWSGYQQSHNYRANHNTAKWRKNRHRMDGTRWPLFRVNNVTDKQSPSRWSSTNWDELDVGKIRNAKLNYPPRELKVGPDTYKPELAGILELSPDDELVKGIVWGRDSFRLLQFFKWLKEIKKIPLDELRSMATRSSPELRRELSLKDLDPNKGPFQSPDDFKPHAWQTTATNRWLEGNGGKHWPDMTPQTGIVEVVTGAGKTVMAIMALEEFLTQNKANKALIIVPTEVLLYQWQAELAKFLNLGPNEVSLLGDGHQGSLSERENTRVTKGIVNSLSMDHVKNRIFDEGVPNPGSLLVIADECHRYRGEKFRNALKWYLREGDARLGLSATPLGEKDDVDVVEDSKDDEDTKLIVASLLGKTYYKYGYEKAAEDELIPEFIINLVGFDLSDGERKKYDIISKKISRSRQKIVDAVGHRLERMRGSFEAKINKLQGDGMRIPGVKDYFEAIRDRKDLLSRGSDGESGLANRQNCFGSILHTHISNDDGGGESETKVLVFQERIIQIQDSMFPPKGKVREMLGKKYYRPSSVHSRRQYSYRNEMSLDLLRKGVLNVIYSAKQLDEGLDVPAVDVGIIRIPTSSLRTMIQRLGRTLRRKGEGDMSTFYVLYARGTTETRFFENLEFKERISDKVIAPKYWDDQLEELVEDPEELVWGRKLDIDWDSLNPGDPVRGRVEGGQFSVSSEWIPFIKQPSEKGRDIRMRITNPDYVEVASVMREMNKPGAEYHDQEGHCVTYRRGKGGTYVGSITPPPEQELALEEYPSTMGNSPRPLIHTQNTPEGSNLRRIMDLLRGGEEE